MAQINSRKTSGKAAMTASEHVASEKGTVNSLKPEPEVTDKFAPQNSTQGKDAGTSQQVQDRNKKKRLRRKVMAKETKDGQKAAMTASELVASEKGTGNSLKPEPEVTDKSAAQNSTQGKDAGTSQQVQERNREKWLRREVKAKETTNGQKVADAKDISSGKETVNSLKPEPDVANKSVIQNSMLGKDAETSQQVQARDNNKRKRRKERGKETKDGQNDANKHLLAHQGIQGKKILTEKREESDKRDHSARKKLGGLIFMCNARTKPDCFHYRVMGVSSSKKELVLNIKPGLKLFLYDFGLKLMYGIYRATSAGGMSLEPAAFGGAFPAQVRFEAEKDCLPLPENVFKKAIRDSYNERTRKFDTELTFEQVKQLSDLFRPVPQLQSNVNSAVREPVLVQPIQPLLPVASSNEEQAYRGHCRGREARGRVASLEYDGKQIPERYGSHSEMPSPCPDSLREREYRSYGFQRDRHLMPPVSAVGSDYGPGQEREQLHRNTAVNGDAAGLHKEAGHPTPYFLSEAEYRTYGLRGRPALPTTGPPSDPNRALEDHSGQLFNPYDDSTTSLVNRYLSMPMPRMMGTNAGPYPMVERETYRNDSNYIDERRGQPERVVVGRGALYSSHDSRAPPDYYQRHHHLGGEPDRVAGSVSSRYSFGGPSVARR